MGESIKGFEVNSNGQSTIKKYDYNSLDNIPELDATLTSPTLSAQGKAVGDAIDSLKNTSVYNASEIDAIDYVYTLGTVSGRLKSDGTVDGSISGWVTTDFIPVESGVRYVLQRLSSTSDYTVHRCTYTSSKTLIQYISFTAQSPERFYDITGNISFVRFSISLIAFNDGFSFRKAKSRVDRVDSYSEFIGDVVVNSIGTRGELDYISMVGVSLGLLQSDGSLNTSEAFRTTEYIPVKSGISYGIQNVNGTSFSIWTGFFDSSKNIIEYRANQEATDGAYYITANDGVSFVKFGFSTNAYNAGIRFYASPDWYDNTELDIKRTAAAIGSTNYILENGVVTGQLQPDGTVDDNRTWVTTAFIPIIPGITYDLKRPGYTGTYSLRRCVYDSNKNLISYISFSAEAPSRIYTAIYGAAFVRFTFSRTVYNMGIAFGLYENYIERPGNVYIDDKSVYKYTGTDVDVNLHKKFICNPLFNGVDASLPSGKTGQAFALYGNVIFQFLADDACRLYNYKNGEILGDIAITCGHANSAVFSNTFYESNDEFPLIYISDTNGNIYVNRITRTGSTLVKTLYFDPSVFGYAPQLSLDSSGYLCHIVGKQSPEMVLANPIYIISTCDLSNEVQSGDVFTIPAHSSFTVTIPGQNIVLQGIKFLNGCIWITSGATNTSMLSQITLVNVQEKEVATILSEFPDIVSAHELEDVDFAANPSGAKYDAILHVREHGYYKMTF